ncbi:hypothetical protein [Hymenobacter sp. BT730]|uniref:hypothetical protein n=1 Tax=Hymenobacter sp. BT730 TaxID=3063332 RepID=UPI0026E0451C|nr:hypothetical protein [Hymenobacter sp. BT730]
MPYSYRASLFAFLVLMGCARQPYFQPDARVPDPAGLRPTGADSTWVTAGRHYQRGWLHNALLGKHYRQVWATPVALPVLSLRTAVPGTVLTPGKMGGGFQTTSLTLDAADGRSYVLRTLDKDPFKTLPKVMRKTFLLTLVRDQTSAGNPYAAFVVPPLAQAAGLLHTTPRPFYVAGTDSTLGPFSKRFQGKVTLLEEKQSGKENLTPAFGKATNIVGSEDMLEQRYADPTHQIDEVMFARARLFDIWLGDWDRHEGQWQWAVYEQNGRTRYQAVPKDRDQVFYRFNDGLLPWLASRRWAIRKFRTFKPRYEDIEGLVKNARFIDARALHEISRSQFQQQASLLQRQLTDSVIDAALLRFPAAVFAQEGARTRQALQARRAALTQAANTFYHLLARHVTIPGTDKAERFLVERLTDSTTRVSMYRITEKDDKYRADSLCYQRTFRTDETRRLTLHGLGGQDIFELSGDVRQGIRVDIYGGPKPDVVIDKSRVRGLGNKTFYYDTNRDNELIKGPSTRDKTTKGVKMHAYDREGS